MKSLMFCLLAISAVLSTSPILSHAKVPELLRNVDGLVLPVRETAYRVSTAKIVLADYALIRNDFPTTRKMSEAEIDTWLLDRAAYISLPQAQQVIVNSKINIQRDAKNSPIITDGYRPQGYGRALVFKADDGLIDVKGSGADQQPELKGHRTGLASLGEALREFIFQKKVQKVLEHSGSGIETVESYAVIDWGFDAKELDGQALRAGAVLRQGHTRPKLFARNHFASGLDSKIFEEVLRKYGITSTGDAQTEAFDRANIQISKDKALIDFGAYLVKDKFEKDVIHYGTSEKLADSSAANFVQPDARFKVPAKFWGSSASGIENPRYDNPWIWSHQLAEALRSGSAKREHVTEHFNNFMNQGLLPAELAGGFKHISSTSFRAKTAASLLMDEGHYSVDNLLAVLKGIEFVEKAVVQQILASQKISDQMAEFLEPYFKTHKVLEKNPGLWPVYLTHFLTKKDETILNELMAVHQAELIDKVLTYVEGFSHQSLKIFLTSTAAKANPLWPKWVSAANATYVGFGVSFLSAEPLTAKHPALLGELLKSPKGPSASQVLAVMEAPHWKGNVEAQALTKQFLESDKVKPSLRAPLLERFEKITKAVTIPVPLTCEGLF